MTPQPQSIETLLTRVLRSVANPVFLASAFEGGRNIAPLLQAIARIDAANGGSARDDLFRAFADDEPFHTAARFTRLMDKWDAHTRPPLPGAAYGWLEQLGLADSPDPYQRILNNAVLLLGARAEMALGRVPYDAAAAPQEPAYHSRIHFLHVLQVVGHLVEKNDHMLAENDPGAIALTDADKSLLLLAALAHDLDHPGRGNAKDPATGQFTLYQNEEKSFALADKILAACGLHIEDRATVRALILTTDPNGPHRVMKTAMKLHGEGKSPLAMSDVAPGEEERYKALAPLLADKKLCAMCAMLSDADLYSSAGAGIEANIVNSAKLTRELRDGGANVDLTTAKARDFFLKNIVGASGFASPAGRRAFNDVFVDMLEKTARELAAPAASIG